jgi:hypothetical protein
MYWEVERFQGKSFRNAPADPPSVGRLLFGDAPEQSARESDPIFRSDQTLLFVWRMIFSENRFPLFGIMRLGGRFSFGCNCAQAFNVASTRSGVNGR